MERGVVIVAGFGFRAAAEVCSLSDALDRAARGREVQLLATAADKARAPAFRILAETLELPVMELDGKILQSVVTSTYSTFSLAARGTGSLAEAAALAAAGQGARLIAQRVVSADRMATCALAETTGEDT